MTLPIAVIDQIARMQEEIDALKAERDAIWNDAIEAAAKHIESDTHNYAICIRRLKK